MLGRSIKCSYRYILYYLPHICGRAIFQAVHDNDHYLTDSDFSLEGEIATYNATAKRAPSLAVQKIIYSESVLRSAAYIFLGHAPISKIVFP